MDHGCESNVLYLKANTLAYLSVVKGSLEVQGTLQAAVLRYAALAYGQGQLLME